MGNSTWTEQERQREEGDKEWYLTKGRDAEITPSQCIFFSWTGPRKPIGKESK
jgi:hypothetical protein